MHVCMYVCMYACACTKYTSCAKIKIQMYYNEENWTVTCMYCKPYRYVCTYVND
jgi:hypothetical protein